MTTDTTLYIVKFEIRDTFGDTSTATIRVRFPADEPMVNVVDEADARAWELNRVAEVIGVLSVDTPEL